jgi:pimeloyl-ACP methyl ester carboxylesterase
MHTHHLTLPDTQLAVHTSGQGRPMLFLHAFPLDHRMWAEQEPLAEHLRLIMPDQRGFGRSRSNTGLTSIEQLADDAVAILDALHVSEPAIVCGCSMGGYVAQHVAVRHPSRVRALVLVDTKLEADTPEARAARADLAGSVRRLGTEIVAEAMVPRFLSPVSEASKMPRRREIEALLRGQINEQSVDTIVAALAALAARPDMTEPMRSLAVPTLLVVGAEDQITPPECLIRAEAIIPVARLLIVPQAGHMPPLETPAIFNAAVLAFLREAGLLAHVPEGDQAHAAGAGRAASETHPVESPADPA